METISKISKIKSASFKCHTICTALSGNVKKELANFFLQTDSYYYYAVNIRD